MPGGVRRPHSKSRYGCTQCKQRKLKCDEVKPKCGNCSKRNLDCSLETEEGSSIIFLPGLKQRSRSKSPNTQSQKLSPSSASSPSPIINSRTGSPAESRNRTLSVEEAASPKNRTLSIGSIGNTDQIFVTGSSDPTALYNHFQASTWKTLCGEESEQRRAALWLGHVLPHAQHHEFVHHSILAVTSLHLALTNPDGASSHQAAANHHHTAAIRSSQPYIRSLQPDMVPPLFVFSILTATYAFGWRKLPVHSLHPVQDAHDILYLLRGTSTIAQNGEQQIEEGPLTGLGLPRLENPDARLPFPVERSLNSLSAYCDDSTMEDCLKGKYREAINWLWFTFVLLQERPGFQLAMLPFAVMSPEEVLQHINEEQPLALVVLAHYAVVLHYLDGHVWQNGWGRWIVDAVAQTLDADWIHCLEWPKHEVARAMHG